MVNHLRVRWLASIGVVAWVAVSCGGGASRPGFAAGEGDAGTESGAPANGDASTSSSGGNLFGDASTPPPPPMGDACPPCSAENVNLASSACDLDCSGTAAPPAPCDRGLAYGGPATDFAKAIGICQMADATHWGLVSASYTRGYDSTDAPAAGQHGILGGFGTFMKPQEGANLAVLSSGFAYPCDDASATASCIGSGSGDPYFKGGVPMYDGNGTPPPGYPKSNSACPLAPDIHDTIGVTLQIKTPANARGFSFDFDFLSGEWPEFVCTNFNDSFVAWLDSAAWAGTAGDLNISWDAKGRPVSVNNGFFGQCTPNTQTGCSGGNTQTAACPGGETNLLGTGFFNVGTYCGGTMSTGGGATGWLTTKAPVKGGETITLQFIIWDTGDQAYDSSVILDNFKWYGTPTTTGTTPLQ
jgi:hypothetical protein